MSTDPFMDVAVLAGTLGALDGSASDIPFSPCVMAFCSELSRRLLTNPEVKQYPDLMTFGYFCRKTNLEKIRSTVDSADYRLGWGSALHIAPSNIPVNFAYSFLFGLLAGNANVVRLPTRHFPQIELFCNVVGELLNSEEYQAIGQVNAFVRFGRDSKFLIDNSEKFDVQLVWGGDQTVRNMRRLERQPRSIEIAFSDRYSLAVIGADALIALDEKALFNLCSGFYNDTFLVDQNACSSPHLIVWQGVTGQVAIAKQRFWNTLQSIVNNRYEMNAMHAMDKQIRILKYLEACPFEMKLTQYGPAIVVAALESIGPTVHELTGIFGLFFEIDQCTLDDIVAVVNKKYQTLIYFGVPVEQIKAAIFHGRCKGIDRVVPIGSALDMDVVWDGYALINTLSRVVSFK